MGDLQIDVPNGATSDKVLLEDTHTLHAPDLCLTVTAVSIGHIVKAGHTVLCSLQGARGNGRIIRRIPVGSKSNTRLTFATTGRPASRDILTLTYILVDAIRVSFHRTLCNRRFPPFHL